MNRKKLPLTLTAVTASMAVLLSATFAWQSRNQTALNEAANVVNPGGRLHDDFDGRNKDVYVENFADEPIFARIRLGEYLALTHNKGTAGERRNVIIGGTDDAGQPTYEIHRFGAENRSDQYWTWETGGSTVYMPTFNKNKDSLAADTNGTYLGPDGIVTDRRDDDRYTDYTAYTAGDTETGTEIYDADANALDEVGDDFTHLADYAAAGSIILKENMTHAARLTERGALRSMADWLALTAEGYDAEQHGGYWVYDTDGWCYWSAPILPDTATGLLLDEIRLCTVMDDSWHYTIEVTAQFVTADDIGKSDHSGFYDLGKGTSPTPQAEILLERITGERLN